MECPDCGSEDWRSNSCETYCGKCGYVSDDAPVVHGAERRGSSVEESAALSRSGPPITWLDPFSQTFTRFNPKRRD